MPKATVRIGRWGNSLGLRLPKELVDTERLSDGDTVEIEVRAANSAASIAGRWKGLITFEEAMRELERLDEEEEID